MELLSTVAMLPPFFLVIFVLFLTFKKPQMLSHGVRNASRDRPHINGTKQALLGIFYVLDELNKSKQYRFMFYIGAIGIIGTTIYLVIILTAFFILHYSQDI